MRRSLVIVAAMICASCSSGLNRPVEEVTAQAGADSVQHVKIVAHSYYFSPNRVVVKAGMPVELTIKNSAFGVPHNLTCFEKPAGIELSEDLGMFRGEKKQIGTTLRCAANVTHKRSIAWCRRANTRPRMVALAVTCRNGVPRT